METYSVSRDGLRDWSVNVNVFDCIFVCKAQDSLVLCNQALLSVYLSDDIQRLRTAKQLQSDYRRSGR